MSLKFTEKQEQLERTISEVNMLSNTLIYLIAKYSINTDHANVSIRHECRTGLGNCMIRTCCKPLASMQVGLTES